MTPLQKALAAMEPAATLVSDALGSRISSVYAHWDGTRFYTAVQCIAAHESVSVADVAVGGVNPAVAAIEFALKTDCKDEFLHCWLHGDFDVLRREWPEAPEEIYLGADPSLERHDYPECSGDSTSCPENEGHGCCKPNPFPQPAPDIAAELHGALKLIDPTGKFEHWRDAGGNLIGPSIAASVVRYEQSINGKGNPA